MSCAMLRTTRLRLETPAMGRSAHFTAQRGPRKVPRASSLRFPLPRTRGKFPSSESHPRLVGRARTFILSTSTLVLVSKSEVVIFWSLPGCVSTEPRRQLRFFFFRIFHCSYASELSGGMPAFVQPFLYINLGLPEEVRMSI